MAFSQQTHRLHRVDVVVSRASPQNRLEQHFRLEDVARASHDLLGRQTDALAVVVNSVADLNEELLKRSLRQRRGSRQHVGERAVDDGVVVGNQSHAVTTRIGSIEGAVQDVGTQRFLRFNQGLREMLRVGLTNTDVIAVFHKHLGQAEGQTIDLVEVTLQEQHATGLVGHGHAVRQFRRRAKTIKNGFFMVIAGNTLLLTEDHLPFVSALIINAVKDFVQDGFNYRPKVGTTHRSSHRSNPPIRPS